MDSTTKSLWWSLTIANPTSDDNNNMHEAWQRGWKLLGQKETSDGTGLVHYQLVLHTPDRPRFSAVKKQFPRAHIEVARNPEALKNYVTKEETRTGQLPESTNQALYPNVEELYRRFVKRTLVKYSTGYEDPEWISIYECYQRCLAKYMLDPENYSWANAEEATLDKILKSIKSEEYLQEWDEFCAQQIREGNHIDPITTNPGIRSFIKRFLPDACIRAIKQIYADSQDKDTE